MKQLIKLIIIIALNLIDYSFQQQLKDLLANKKCDKVPIEEKLSDQINQFGISLSKEQNLKYPFYNCESFAEKNTDVLFKNGFVCDEYLYNIIQEEYKDGKKKIQFTKFFLSLPQFYLVNEQQTKGCGSSYFQEQIGSNYNDCLLCSGSAFFPKNSLEAKKNQFFQWLHQKSISNQYYIYSFQDSKVQQFMIQSFQLLWNCNNPQDSIKVTSNLDEQTKKKLALSPSNGFDKICKFCSDKNCQQCMKDYTSCIVCADGYILQNGKCIQCSLKNCSQCSKNKCNTCSKDYFLYNSTCVNKCPEGTNARKGQCIMCNEGTFFNGDSCQNCVNKCKKCNGPSEKDCLECHFGFIIQNKMCVVCNDSSKCPGAVCELDQFRSSVSPFKCEKCDVKCQTCSSSGPSSCLSCHDGFNLAGGRCTNILYQPSTYVDANSGQTKQCNFSCSECIDNTNLCIECNPDLKYFIKDGDRKICQVNCPINYVANDQDQSKDFYECKLIESYSKDQRESDKILQEALSRCPDYTYWDIDSSTCNKCANRCLSCHTKNFCSKCEPGYYWDEQQLMCLACHNTCKKCIGPLYSQCIVCKDSSQMYPNTQGICNIAAKSQAPTLSNAISSLEIFGDLSKCQVSYRDSLSKIYTVNILQTFSSQDINWRDIELISSKTSCKFDDFKRIYSSLKSNTSECNSITKTKISTKGQLTVIYSMLLNQSGVKIDSKDVNPSTLAQFAIANQKYSTYYVYKPKGKFSCDYLSCESTLDYFINIFDTKRNQRVSIQQTDEIILTSNGQPINCRDSSLPIYDQQPLKEFQQTVFQAMVSTNMNSKVYFFLEACITGFDGKQTKKTFLATDFYEKGFVKALDVDNQNEEDKYNIFYIQGAFNSQNDYLKKCNPSYKNKFQSYLVTGIKKVEVEFQNTEIDQAEIEANQIIEKNTSTNPTQQSKNCNCIQTKEYILQNEGQGGELKKVISPDDIILTQSIKVNDITDILKQNKLDPLKMKANKIAIPSLLADKMFDQYLDKIQSTTKKCYDLTTSSNTCIQNVLVDIVFSNSGKCINSVELKLAVSNNDFKNVMKLISETSYCKSQNIRCSKHIQVLKGCQ